MKTVITVISMTLALGLITAVAGIGGTNNVCLTNLVHTNIVHTNTFGTNGLGPLSQYDLDGDGTITSNEFATASSNLVQDLQSKFLAKYDANQDGTVTSDEALA